MTQRARSLDVIIRILSVLLAALFITTGGAKLIGAQPFALQAAAMTGFPQWIRVLVGVAELVLGAALLVPRLTGVAAPLLALIMVFATLAQWVSGEPGVAIPIALFVVLVAITWLSNPAVVRSGREAVAFVGRPVIREGIIVGVIGATIIAVWFFFVDLVARDLFFTPRTLGQGILAMFGPLPAGQSPMVPVVAYTVFHYAAFVLLGIAAAGLVELANQEPSILLGFVVLFVATEVGFYALVSVLQQVTDLGALAWYNVMIGNLLAAAGMGAYLLRAHPVLREQFRHSLDRPA